MPINTAADYGLTPVEHQALIYFTRIDELAETGPVTDLAAVVARYESMDASQARAALACLCGVLHSMVGSFAESEHWFHVATEDAEADTWVHAWIDGTHARNLLWNGDLDLASELIREASRVRSPFDWQRIIVTEIHIHHHRQEIELARVVGERLDAVVDGPMPTLQRSDIAVLRAMYLVPTDLDETECVVWPALLRARPDVRSTAQLITLLSYVMARRGHLSRMAEYHGEAMDISSRWPAEAASFHRSFYALVDGLGLGPPQDALTAFGPPKDTDRAIGISPVRGIRDRAIEALRSGDHDTADAAIDELLSIVGERIRSFETLEARQISLRTLIDLRSLAPELGLAGRIDDMCRLIGHLVEVIQTDQSHGPTSERLRDRLSAVLDAALAETDDPDPVLAVHVADLEQRIHLLDWRAHRPEAPPITGWKDRPLPDGPLLAFGETRGRVLRLTVSDGVGDLVDVGAAEDIASAARAVRLAAAAVPLDPAANTQHLRLAVDILDRLLFSGCEWIAGSALSLFSSDGLDSLPWRLLPTLSQLDLTVGLRPAVSVEPQRSNALVIDGQGIDAHHRFESSDIGVHYPQSVEVRDPTLSVAELITHCAAFDVVHLTVYGPLGPLKPRAQYLSSTSSERFEPIEHSRPMADVVVLSTCDLETAQRERGARLAWVLLACGVGTVVSSPIDLDDHAVAEIMPQLHRRLAAGEPPDTALRQLAFDDPDVRLAADSFLAYSLGGGRRTR